MRGRSKDEKTHGIMVIVRMFSLWSVVLRLEGTGALPLWVSPVRTNEDIKRLRRAAGVCPMCGGKPAYKGAIYCGGACTARSEAHHPPRAKKGENLVDLGQPVYRACWLDAASRRVTTFVNGEGPEDIGVVEEWLVEIHSRENVKEIVSIELIPPEKIEGWQEWQECPEGDKP